MYIPIFYRTICGLLVFAIVAAAQTKRQQFFNHPLTVEQTRSAVAAAPYSPISTPETTKILVAMIAFQEDNDTRTSGNGSFDSSSTTKKIIDAPPHNISYVQQHLTFLENYFRKVSGGKKNVQGTVLDRVYKLGHPMQYYSPSKSSTTNDELGNLVQDTWQMVDTTTPGGVSFGKYNLFMVFHAGVGRDINLVDIYGYDPTPFDLPSIYFNLGGLQKIFGQAYKGVAVQHGTFFVANSMIIPETENRELQTVSGTTLLQLGINGLLAASVGSHLGLPDLFDTKTGKSGIGRFGLMDGQSIFSWNGVFPPEPSAWEKYFLGWIQPIDVPVGESFEVIPAVSLSNSIDTVYRVPISAKEYFLLENRNRDANRDGDTITMIFSGNTIVKYWQRDTVGFRFFDQDSLYGVITDVDEFDVSLPGGVSNNTKELFDGGILIWHIDENVIEANYALDAVNSNPERRGVDLEEADGSQDIGQSYPYLSPGSGSEDGTPLDFWYRGNSALLRRDLNAFTPISHPSSLSNDLANSYISIGSSDRSDTSGFSYRGPRMTVKIKTWYQDIKPLPGFPKNTARYFGKNPIAIGDLSGDGNGDIMVATQSRGPGKLLPGGTIEIPIGGANLFGWKTDGSSLHPYFHSSGLIARAVPVFPLSEFNGKPVVGDFNNDHVVDFAITGKSYSNLVTRPQEYPFIGYYSSTDNNHDSLADINYLITPTRFLTTSLVASDTIFCVGSQHSGLYFISSNGNQLSDFRLSATDTSEIIGINLWRKPDTFVAMSANGLVGLVTPSGIIKTGNFSKILTSPAVAGNISSTMGKHIAFASKDGYVYLVDSSLTISPGFPVFTGGEILNSPALADIDGDGQRDIIVFSGNKVYAINASGAILDNFPITVSTDKTILTSPIIADLDGNGTPDIVAVTQEGLVVAHDKSGKMVRGFPLLAGVNGGSTPVAFQYFPAPRRGSFIGLAVASDDGYVYAWQTGFLGLGPADQISEWQNPWPQYMHDAQNTGLDESILTLKPKSKEFLPASLAYNWPNPVGHEHGFRTHIRYFVRENANVSIKIFDLAGDMVTEMKAPGIGNLDNEVEWDVSKIQSGIYFARIEAQGTNKSGVAVIKIAVVK